MGANSSRQYTYQQYYNAAEKSGVINEIDFKNIDIESINPYEVLNVPKNFTWDELKISYRKLAINTHPDKQGGNKDLFNIITHCFKKLADELKMREEDKSHHDLKQQSNDFFHKMTNEALPHPSEVLKPNEKFTNTKFNKNFEKCKLYDEEIEFGYGSKMEESTKKREDINIEKLIKKNKIDNESFNEIFNKNVPVNKELIKYREPEPLILSKSLQYTELGGKRPDDYSSSIEKTNTLAYTDYMRAHDGTRLVDPRLMKNVKEFKSVDEYEAYRDDKSKKILSAKELKKEELKALKGKKEEEERLERLRIYDKKIEKSYEKASQLFLR
jgi:curved DNA-binding protein CbpA|uniref:J domain-containing protein n=1 Tax=viral metagenome TaxID=1070528 RepID=A0A6C0IAU5_9ZZZZ